MYEDEENNLPEDKEIDKGNSKPQQSTRKKLENYLEELELRKQLDDFYDQDEKDAK